MCIFMFFVSKRSLEKTAMVKQMCIDAARTLSQSFSIVTEIPEWSGVSNLGLYHRNEN